MTSAVGFGPALTVGGLGLLLICLYHVPLSTPSEAPIGGNKRTPHAVFANTTAVAM